MEGEIINRRKDHRQYLEFMTITPVRDPDGAIGHFVAVKQDITARKRTEAALRQRGGGCAPSSAPSPTCSWCWMTKGGF